MKLCRFQPLLFSAAELGGAEKQMLPEPSYGIISGEMVGEITGSIFGHWSETGRVWALDEVKLLPPVTPSKIVCLGRNYREHAAEFGERAQPVVFLKPPSAVIGPEEPIVLPPMSARVDFEGELAMVMRLRCSRLREAESTRPYLLGFTCLNDVTARDLQGADVQWTRAKSFDTFCPLGPVVETELALDLATLETFVNGVQRQAARFSQMIFSVDAIIRWISQVMTLEPGDVVATGTPAGVGPLYAGDVVEVSISGVGTLRNPVVAQEP